MMMIGTGRADDHAAAAAAADNNDDDDVFCQLAHGLSNHTNTLIFATVHR